MIELAYISSAVAEFDKPKLVELLKTCYKNNGALGITGLLVYNGKGTFLQILEGEEQSVLSLYETIKRDPLHTRITCLGKKRIKERGYPDWKMGFRNLEHSPVDHLKGYSDFMNDENPQDLSRYSDFSNLIFSHFKESSRELIF